MEVHSEEELWSYSQLHGILCIQNKEHCFFLVTIKQRQVIKCFRCLSDKSSTVLQHLFKAVLLSEKIPNFLLKFTAHHIFFWVLVAVHPLQQLNVSLLPVNRDLRLAQNMYLHSSFCILRETSLISTSYPRDHYLIIICQNFRNDCCI